MTERTRVIDAIKQLRPQELLQVADFIEALQDTPQGATPDKDAQPDYLAVRKALSTLRTPLSTEVDQERNDRV